MEQLEELRQRLARNKSDAPLFNIARYTRGLEAAFEHMADIRADGHAPRAFSVTEIDEPDEERRAAPAAAAKPEPAAKPSAPKSIAPHLPAARIDYKACPLCNSPEISPYKEADCTHHPRYDATLPPAMIWCRCGSCQHVFTQGYFAPETVNAVFAKSAPDSRVGHDIEAGRIISARIVGNVARHKASGDWLDVGFGSASLLFTAEEWGFRPVGLDLHPDNAQALKGLGYESHCAPIEKLDFPGRFSVVSIADYLERAPYPRATLDAVHRLLQPGGVLFVALPNMATIVWRLLDTSGNNPFWGDIEHYHNFTRERLYALLQTHGFKPAAYAVSERDDSGMEVIAVKV